MSDKSDFIGVPQVQKKRGRQNIGFCNSPPFYLLLCCIKACSAVAEQGFAAAVEDEGEFPAHGVEGGCALGYAFADDFEAQMFVKAAAVGNA